jgi:hypothetical protein
MLIRHQSDLWESNREFCHDAGRQMCKVCREIDAVPEGFRLPRARFREPFRYFVTSKPLAEEFRE